MSRALITEGYLTDIADAIRAKTGSSDTYTPAQMAGAIDSIPNYPEPTGSVAIRQNGAVNVKDYATANVSVPNSYTVGDEGKVVQNGTLIGQSGRNINVNGRYNTTTNNEVVVNVAEGGSAKVIPKNISANGYYDADSDDVDGYSSVNVNVPNTYGVGDEGKVVSGSELVAQTPTTKNANGTYDTTTNNQVVIDVPNTYTQADEGKVVNNGALVSQTSRSVTANGTYTTTTNNEVVVNVQPTLQSKTVTENGTVTADSGYDGLSQVVVNVQGGVALPHILANNICARNQSHSGGILPTEKKFLLMAINSDASNETLNPDVAIEGSPVTAETTEYHEYSSTGDNRRNYRINVYDVSENAGDVLSAGFTMLPAHMSWLYAYVSADFEISKVMTSAEAATSGSNSEDGCVLYGTINDNSGGTLTAADYTAGTTITTDDPGSGYKSSFIVWLTKASGDVTVEPLSVTQNGTYTAPTGKAYSPVAVSVQPNLQTKTATQNGTVTPDQGYDGLSSVVVSVPGGVDIEPLSATQNGTYTAPTGKAYSPVVVNVSGGGAQGVYRGTSEPLASIGSNGDYYIQDIPLPSSVNYVDYLESSGAQYIDTDIKGDQTTTVYARFRTVASNPDGAVFGARQSYSSRQFCIVQNKTSGKVRLDYYSSNDNTTITLSPNTEYELIHGQVVYNANGKIAVISTNISSFETPGSMYIFGMNNNGALLVGTGVIIYRLTIRKNGLVVADFVPALDVNNVPCMYEAVSGTYYYNAGSGAFSYGSPVSPIQSNNVYKKANGTWSIITQSGVSMV